MNHAVTPRILYTGISPTVGDTAIGQATLSMLKARLGLPIHAYVDRPEVFALMPELQGDADQIDSSLTWKLPRLGDGWRRRLGYLRICRKLERGSRGEGLPDGLRDRFATHFDGAAALVLQGGPNWADRWTDLRSVMERRLMLAAARSFGVPAYHLGVGCGPFAWSGSKSWSLTKLARHTLNLYDTIVVRDQASGPALKRLGVQTHVIESTDMAVGLTPQSDPRYTELAQQIDQSPSPKLVVCVRDFQHNYPQMKQKRADIIDAFAQALDQVTPRLGSIWFLSTDQQAYSGKATDADFAREIQAKRRGGGAVIVDQEVALPSALKDLYGRFDAMLSLRLHPTILALGQGVPSAVISYDRKCEEFFQQVGRPHAMLRPEEISVQRLVEAIDALLAENDRSAIRSAMTTLVEAQRGALAPVFEAIGSRADAVTVKEAG